MLPRVLLVAAYARFPGWRARKAGRSARCASWCRSRRAARPTSRRARSPRRSASALGQQVVVENRGGGGGAVGAGEVARAAPDGYTILFAANAVSILHLAVKNLPYDTLRDFVPITQVTTQPNAFAVHPSVPATSIKELVALRQGQSRQAVLRPSRARAAASTSPASC